MGTLHGGCTGEAHARMRRSGALQGGVWHAREMAGALMKGPMRLNPPAFLGADGYPVGSSSYAPYYEAPS